MVQTISQHQTQKPGKTKQTQQVCLDTLPCIPSITTAILGTQVSLNLR